MDIKCTNIWRMNIDHLASTCIEEGSNAINLKIIVLIDVGIEESIGPPQRAIDPLLNIIIRHRIVIVQFVNRPHDRQHRG